MLWLQLKFIFYEIFLISNVTCVKIGDAAEAGPERDDEMTNGYCQEEGKMDPGRI